jgi:hypothetical protein
MNFNDSIGILSYYHSLGLTYSSSQLHACTSEESKPLSYKQRGQNVPHPIENGYNLPTWLFRVSRKLLCELFMSMAWWSTGVLVRLTP